MKLVTKLASIALLSLTAAVSQASAQSFGVSWGGHVSIGATHGGYANHNNYYNSAVVYRPVAQAPVYYVQPQTAYVARPIVEQVVSHRYVKRQAVQTYYEAVPTYRNQVVGYQYHGYTTHRGYYGY